MSSRTVALPQVSDVVPGVVLAGKYRVDGILGRGGMGVVVAATHLQLEQKVAIKLILPGADTRPEAIERFEREARAMVRLQSEHVVRVRDVGKLENGAPFMVMEYLAGQDLAQLVAKRGPLPIGEAVEYVLQALEALAEAHRLGIVHRDLKPANLFLTQTPDGAPLVKVLDFGISKAILQGGAEDRQLTQTHAQIGSPAYMSPEQLKSSRDVDARADVWSLGLVLYELLAGVTAFQATTLAELHVAILAEAPKSLRQKRPDVPYGLEAVILRCLEKNPSARFGDVGELARALAEFAPPRASLSIERASRIAGRAPSAPSMPPYSAGAAPAGMGPASSYAPTSYASSQPQPWSDPRLTPQPLPFQQAPTYPTQLSPMQMSQAPPRKAASPAWAFVGIIVLFFVVATGFGGCILCVALAR